MKRIALYICLLGTVCGVPLNLFAAEVVENQSAALARIRADIEYLAADALEGRGVMTAGNQKAADYIRASFKEDGLQGGMPDGRYFQIFPISLGAELNAKESRLLLKGDEKSWTLSLGDSYQPLAAGGGGQVHGELVFTGYGITAPDESYDDYADINVQDKIVLILRKEPGQGDPNGPFQGTETTKHAYINTKLQAAATAGAAAVLLVNDASTVAQSVERDELAEVNAFGTELARIPFAQVTREAVNRLLAEVPLETASGKLSSLNAIEERINTTMSPVSRPLGDVTVDLDFAFEKRQVEVANVVGIVPGKIEDEYVVVGAHFDHIGYGAVGSRKPGVHEIHNGADDNASGTAALLELARRVASGQTPPRSVVFIAFNGEERGLLGSNYYVAHPPFPLKKTTAMMNFDMVGRWGDNPLTIFGQGTAEEFDELLEPIVAAEGDDLQAVDKMLSASDHYGFYLKQVPVFHFFTGLTEEYHTPADDVETLDFPGIVRAVDVAERVLRELLAEPDGFEYTKVDIESPSRGEMSYLGVIPDYSADVDGLRIHGTSDPESPAAKAGFLTGDVITKFGDIAILDIQGLAKALRTYKPGEEVVVEVLRGEKPVTLSITLGEPQG